MFVAYGIWGQNFFGYFPEGNTAVGQNDNGCVTQPAYGGVCVCVWACVYQISQSVPLVPGVGYYPTLLDPRRKASGIIISGSLGYSD